MTKEETDLLMQDLCGRLPYEVKGKVEVDYVVPHRYDTDGFPVESTFDAVVELRRIDSGTFELFVDSNTGNEDLDNYIWESQTDGAPWTIYEFKPYLRPMSSMTKEEYKSYENFIFVRHHDWDGHSKHTDYVEKDDVILYTDWLNSHHFDYRGLIEKGLALEAPEDMYKI